MVGPDAWDWWEQRRFRYNIGLVIAGPLAFACYFLQPRPEGDFVALRPIALASNGFCRFLTYCQPCCFLRRGSFGSGNVALSKEPSAGPFSSFPSGVKRAP